MDNIFKDNPNLTGFYQTSDGEKFYNENLAKNHAKDLKDKSVTHVERPAEKEARKSAAEIIALVPEMDLETAQEYLDAEIEGSPRKTVTDALSARITELEK